MGKNRLPNIDYGAFLRIDGLNIHVWEAGSGVPVVLIHGFMSMAYDWRFNIPELSTHFAVYSLDLPGFGYSDKPLDFVYTTDSYAGLILEYMNLRKLNRAIVVGNSMGGQIALQMCLRSPGRVSGLVLIDSGGYPHSVGFLPFKLLSVPMLGELAMTCINGFVIRTMLKNGIFYDGAFADDEVVNRYYDVYRTANARRIPPAVIRSITRDEAGITSNLNNIKCPTLILWGAEDKVIAPSHAERFNRNIENTTEIIIPSAGHMPHIEKSDIVNKAIIEFAGALA